MANSGFCTHCRIRIEDFEGLSKCPNCGTSSIPCADTDQIDININWHELHLLCCWAERWGQHIESAGSVYSIAQALEEQFPDRGPLTFAGEVNELKKTFPGTKLTDADGNEIQT